MEVNKDLQRCGTNGKGDYPYEELLCSIMDPAKDEMYGLQYTSTTYDYIHRQTPMCKVV